MSSDDKSKAAQKMVKKVCDKDVVFKLVDNTAKFGEEDWKKVACVFVVGQAFQFKTWPLGNDVA